MSCIFSKYKIVENNNKLYIALKRTNYDNNCSRNILFNVDKEVCFYIRLWPRSIYAIHSIFCYINLDLLHWRPYFCIYLWYFRVLFYKRHFCANDDIYPYFKLIQNNTHSSDVQFRSSSLRTKSHALLRSAAKM